ncbi:D-alanyl-D-alanine carboxypeptidase [Polaribacter sp. SA4-10]|uniref:serine hydrolase domain-containing protein n=1 Tax=Polaribacter sp. SA4-10 TaxID=754397 RepID=UPI000B3CF5C5|nr:serine hydrolase domain-containing protein [Polaribacter sp. SA4-10]ARV07884.1 D-alanyl-D-alanine carboxypeptidase [Polaribacter sp. SA4-10]
MKKYENFANLLINTEGSAPIYNCLLTINSAKKNINYNIALGQIDATDKKIASNYRFRTGSITKTFTSTIILQLMEEGLLKLEDPFLDSLQNVETKKILSEILFFDTINYSNKITIKNLLQHKSGLRDYFSDDERFFANIKKYPNQEWDWKKVLEKYFEYGLNKKGVCKPSESFYYSDTNYLLLALLIEELTNKTYSKVLEERILNPLSLNDTYLEFYQNKKGATPVIFPYHGIYSLENINTSFDWGGGGLISSTNDLNIFIRSLLTGKLFNDPKTLKQMINFEDDSIISTQKKEKIGYGMGLQQKKIGKHNFIGHNSAYGGMVFYNLETDSSFILNINQVLAPHKAEWLLKKMVEAFFLY